MNEHERVIVLTGRTDIRAGQEFTFGGREYVALTNPIGATRSYPGGVTLEVGMLNDPIDPMPVGAICAVRKEGARETD